MNSVLLLDFLLLFVRVLHTEKKSQQNCSFRKNNDNLFHIYRNKLKYYSFSEKNVEFLQI